MDSTTAFDRQSHVRGFVFFAGVGLGALIFLVANIVASQFVYPPLMFRLMSLSDSQAAREFLADLEPSSDVYQSQRKYLNGVFNNIFDSDANINNLNTEKALVHYEKLLALSPNNPQLHVKLGLLYKEKGMMAEATGHFEKAQEIDPWIDLK